MSERAEDREQMMKRHLVARGIRDDRLPEAFRSVPRDAFLPSSRSRPRDRSGRAGSPRAGAGRRARRGSFAPAPAARGARALRASRAAHPRLLARARAAPDRDLARARGHRRRDAGRVLGSVGR